MAEATLVYVHGLAMGAADLFNKLNTLLTNPFSSTNPRGGGWSLFYSDGYDAIYSSLGSGSSERIYMRLTVSGDNQYLDRKIAQVARASDGHLSNSMGDSTTRINVGSAQFEYWTIFNKDFIHLVLLVGSTYSHYYTGIINRFAPNQNSSIYGQLAPSPINTTTPGPIYTIGTGTTLFLRTGFDLYGGYGGANLCFIPGQTLYIIDQSIGTTTTGNTAVVILNSADPVANTINVTYVSGSTNFSSFAMVSVDPQPVAINTGGVIRGSAFMMVDDFLGDATPQFNAVDEFAAGSGLPGEDIQNPDLRGVYVTYPIRLSNAQEIRGTLYGIIDTPSSGAPGPQDLFRTFDGLYVFVNFPDGPSHTIGIGSVV